MSIDSWTLILGVASIILGHITAITSGNREVTILIQICSGIIGNYIERFFRVLSLDNNFELAGLLQFFFEGFREIGYEISSLYTMPMD